MNALIRRPPWSPRSWRQALDLLGAIPVQLVPAVLITAGFFTRPSWLFPLIFGILAILAEPLLTRIERYRLRSVAGVSVAGQPVPSRWTAAGLVAYIGSGATWRRVGYHLVAAPLLAVAAIAAFTVWVAGWLYALVYLYAWRLADNSLLDRGQSSPPAGHLTRFAGIPVDVYVMVAGVLLLVAAPWVTTGVAALDALAAQALLGPSRAEELEHRVEHLTQTRAGVVDAADAERRRIERDLHDGTQQRLVSLAMRLGMARTGDLEPDAAQQVIAEAHEEAKAALTELRHLVRGLHPAVLEDRGLDAALSGIAARVPIPVKLTVDVPRRPPPTVEAVAYFVVSEGLANVTKHAQASQAEVFVQRAGDRLHIIVSDDGAGGADPARGTGLAGLARRAESVDGTFEIVSPPGGPTLITVDLPCSR